jgi:hypothetical protein
MCMVAGVLGATEDGGELIEKRSELHQQRARQRLGH